MIPEKYLPDGWTACEDTSHEKYQCAEYELSIFDGSNGSHARAIMTKRDDSEDGVLFTKADKMEIIPPVLWVMANTDRVMEHYYDAGEIWMMDMWNDEEATEIWRKSQNMSEYMTSLIG